MGKRQKDKSKKITGALGFPTLHWKGIIFLIEMVSLVFIFLGVLLNPFALRLLLGKIDMFSHSTQLYIGLFEAVMLSIGCGLFILQKYFLTS